MRVSKFESELPVCDGRVDWSQPIRLAVRFDDGSRLRLKVAGDGVTLAIDRDELDRGFDLGEFGRFGTHEIANRLDPTLRNAAVGDPIGIRDRAGRLIGMALPRPETEAFCIWVDREKFYWGTASNLAAHEWSEGVESPPKFLFQPTNEPIGPNLDLCAPLP